MPQTDTRELHRKVLEKLGWKVALRKGRGLENPYAFYGPDGKERGYYGKTEEGCWKSNLRGKELDGNLALTCLDRMSREEQDETLEEYLFRFRGKTIGGEKVTHSESFVEFIAEKFLEWKGSN